MTFRHPTRSMWAQAMLMLEKSDRLHRQFFHLGRTPARGPSWEPPVDVFESARALTILVALPGVNPSQLEVLVEGGALVVRGERPVPVSGGDRVLRLEIPYGRFERRIDLPEGHYEIGERTLAEGSLKLVLRKLP